MADSVTKLDDTKAPLEATNSWSVRVNRLFWFSSSPWVVTYIDKELLVGTNSALAIDMSQTLVCRMNTATVHAKVCTREIDGSDGSGTILLCLESEKFVRSSAELAVNRSAAVTIEAFDVLGVHTKVDVRELGRTNRENIMTMARLVGEPQGFVRAGKGLTIDNAGPVVFEQFYVTAIKPEKAFLECGRLDCDVLHDLKG